MTKNLIKMLIIFSTVPAFACPDLSGKFDCTSESASGPVTSFILSTGTENGQVVYQINGTKLVANGVPDKRSKGDNFATTYTTSCEGQTLRTRVQTHVSSAICPTMPLAVDSVTLFTPAGKQIQVDDLTVLSCPDKAPMKILNKYICNKK